MIKFPARGTKQTGERLEIRYRPATMNHKKCSRCKFAKYLSGNTYECEELGKVIGSYTCDMHELKAKYEIKV